MPKLDTTTESKTSRQEASRTPEREVVRLSVNLAGDVAAALKSLSRDQNISITEGVRRAIAVWKLVSEANQRGERVMIVQGEGSTAQYREMIML